ncbi:MAG: urate hydroxylase PuuD, partial [Candidatus Eisenbacteria bacterium]|nr:urate hydroxylase PuuD [Candidatus Eisenbacteria bacterium]
MATLLLDWLHLLIRIAHVVAAILWIGDSFLFMWMDRSLVPPSRPRPGDVAGELWMVHSGGFYEVVKRRTLVPAEMPAALHWFKWEAYSTGISGFFLLGIVYFAGAGMFLVDPAVAPLSAPAAIAIGVALLIAGVAVYEALWRSPLQRGAAGTSAPAASIVCSLLIVATIVGLTRLFAARAAFLMAGAML